MSHLFFKPLLAASITGAAFVTGCQISLSYVSLASILGPKDLDEKRALGQFRSVFDRGFHLCPLPAIASGLCCFANAALVTMGRRSDGSTATRLIASGLLMIGLVPYTLIFILPTEEWLLKREKNANSGLRSDTEEKKTWVLLRRWGQLNYIRAIFPLAGMVLAWTLV
ncbi:hypothetical protein MAPG_07044 [Magnaporthiopsis poae ATCC 64411]|uniref:DUF1772 domain-containing protein n=1 Tax=Magnaporthiopsis poae (strain ATCC 64411 / 73-15) TaxID=644358 RepID=A0A0C4E3N1_MAGP6|nr:hypothetical protein MAPG_07044 [Magnaporthiopsis poae ATCC 64411]